MKKAWLLGCLVVSVLTLFGQEPFFQEYNLLGRGQSIVVKSILQGRSGYLWIATDKGLFKFDGIKTTRFIKLNGLAEDQVTAVAVDSLGRIWTEVGS